MFLVCVWDHVRGRREARGEEPMWLQRWGVWKGAEGDGAD